MARKKYLNNRDLLKQIHISKNTYSSFTDDDYTQYDIILDSLSRVNMRTIAQAKRNKADRIQKLAYQALADQGIKSKLAEHAVNWKKFDKTDVVFRIHTFDHVPLEPGRKKNPKTVADHHKRVYFPPFQHYVIDASGELECVGKSHWEGGMANGFFNDRLGRMTNELGKMFMKLCERYGSRYNWRGYTYNDEMQQQALMQLSQVGLQFDENKSQNPFAYYTAIINASFTRVLNIEKRGHNIRDDILEMNGLTPSYTRQATAHDQSHQDSADKIHGVERNPDGTVVGAPIEVTKGFGKKK